MLKTLGKYELVAEVGRGAMGEVYKAIDPLIGRPVALKTITTSLVGDPELLARFYREARSAGALEHPNIVTIYELGKSADIPFIAMEFLEGESLEKVIERRPPMSLVEKIGFIVPVCRALEYAHKRRVVHRDIKPANIMITKDGKIKVVDFGIARLMNASHTQTNVFIGTISYMSPQMIYGERADERSDIWALGVTLYELVCYRRPFEGDNHASLMLSIAQESSKFRPVSHFLPDCPPALETIIGRMLEKDVTKRFQTMDEVLSEVEPFWENLRQESVSGLVEESEAFLREKEFYQARDLLRKALQIDSRNGHAKMLLEQVSSEVRLIQVKSQVAGMLERAQRLHQEGRYKDAQTELEGAVRLDPSSAAACELLAEVQRLIERKQAIEEGLQIGRQRLAEGALTAAMQEIQKVLERDSENAQGRALQKQIQDLMARREEQKRIVDFLHRARKFWAEQRYSDCVELLAVAQKEFPRDLEIAKLLETAKVDLSEQQKQSGLAEARGLLAGQRFDDALGKTQSLLKQYPGDSAVQKLHEHVIHEKEETARRLKLNTEITALRSRVNAGKFSEAIVRGEKLLKEFPQDTDVADIVSFARSELEQLERRRKKEEFLQGIQKKIEAEQFKNAVATAEKAVARFRDDREIALALEQARGKLKEKEDHELLQRRVAEIRGKINKGQHTDAVDLARQTLATLGHNDQAADLLRMAEIELAQKREKEREQEQQVLAAQMVVEEGRYADATQIIRGALETKLLSRRDPRVLDLLKRIREKKAAPAQTEATADETQVEDVAIPASEAVTEVAPLEKTVIQFDAPLEPPRDAPSAIEPTMAAASETVRETFSATVVSGESLEEELSAASPRAAERPSTQEVSLFRLDDAAADKASPDSTPSGPILPKLIEFVRARPIPFGAGALVLVIVIAVVTYAVSNRPTKEDLALRAQAQQFEQQKDWPAALAGFVTLSHSGRGLAGVGRENAARLKRVLDQEDLLLTKARTSESAGDLSTAKDFYGQLAGLHGDKEQQALSEVQRLDAALHPPPSQPQADPKHDRTKATSSGKAEAQAAAKETPKTTGPTCQLNQADVSRRLDRAERARSSGNYPDAERLYKEVLVCDPNNDKAKQGLERTHKALEIEGGHSGSY